MSRVEIAYAAFRDYAASKMGVPTSQIQGGPGTEQILQMIPGTIGSVWGYQVKVAGRPESEVRGWATGDGTVITLDQNLGVLLAEAGVWGGGVSPSLTADQLAEKITWSLINHSVFIGLRVSPEAPAPELVVKDGVGTLRFVINAARGRELNQLTRIDIALTADRKATATRAKIPAQ